MPVLRHIPENKRRSRKGCLVCRKRRRKCDEQRPKCQNCVSRGVPCEYGQWTFVSQTESFPHSGDDTLQDPGDDSELMDVPAEDPSSIIHASSPVVPFHPHEPSSQPPATLPGPAHHDSPWTSLSSPHATRSINEAITPSKWNDPNFPMHGSSGKQAAMLRFRYQLVPWIDAKNCKSTFGPKIMNLAHDKNVITDCILYYAKFRDVRAGNSRDLGEACHVRQSILERLVLEDAFTADVGRVFLATSDLFHTPLSQWTGLTSYYTEASLQDENFEDTAEPLKSLLRLQLKIDLASCIVAKEPPSHTLPLPLRSPFTMRQSLAADAYDVCLYYLTKTLQLVHHELIPLLSGFHTSQAQDADFYTAKWAQWLNLWTNCTKWFQDRPRAMCPVLESPDVEVTRDVPFPADVYTSAIALQANLVMHMAAVFLLAYKPRLVKLPRHTGRLNSRSWHAQKIARITVWNNFDEQWDPIVIAALFFVAKEMTHASQQDALLACFKRITDTTRIPLEEDIAHLQGYWRMSCHENPPQL